MKKLLTLLLAVCLLAALAVPMTASAAKVDLGTKAQDAINTLAKYNSTPVGEAFNTKTIIGYVFGTLCADDTYFLENDNRYERYQIPAMVLEGKLNASFAGAQAVITELQKLEVDDFSFEYTQVQPKELKVYQGANYFFNKYNLDRTEIVTGYPKKSGTGYVVENPTTYTVNGYKAAGGYKYDVYATAKDGSIVKFAIEWGGGDIKFLSTAAAASVPGGLTAPGNQADLPTTTTAKPTTTTTTKAKPTTTTTTKPTAGNNGTTTTTALVDDGEIDLGSDPTDNVTTTTTTKAQDSAGNGIITDGAVEDTTEQDGEDNTTLYVIIGVVLGVIVLGIIAAIVIVMVKMKKK